MMRHDPFLNRTEAGKELAELLKNVTRFDLVLGIPRGGLEVAAPIAEQLKIPLDAIVTRKLPIPWSTETGFGAITDDRTIILDQNLVRSIGLSQEEIDKITDDVYSEVLRRQKVYRGDQPDVDCRSKEVLIVDDGLATGYTMLAAVRSVKDKGAVGVNIAVPVTSSSARRLVKPEVDRFVTIIDSPAVSFAVAMFYVEWRDLTDNEVSKLLERFHRPQVD